MRYMVLITKHHDGYCLFKTKTTKLNSVEMGPRKDLVAGFVDACHRRGMRVGLYFSLPDWSKPAFFEGPDANPDGWRELVELDRAQLRELMSNYGKIDMLWYDNIIGQSGSRPLTAADYQSESLNRMARELQPEIMINDRSLLPEDFFTAEQNLRPPTDKSRLWEACLTMNKHWGYFPADQMWKSPAELVNLLTGCASFGGNMLLNIGPKPDGTIPTPNVKNLKALGKWLRVHGEAIYGAERCPVDSGTAGVFTQKGGTMYLIVHWWPGRRLALPDFPYEIRSMRILGHKSGASWRREGKRVILEGLPARAPDRLCSVIAIETTGANAKDAGRNVNTNFREQADGE